MGKVEKTERDKVRSLGRKRGCDAVWGNKQSQKRRQIVQDSCVSGSLAFPLQASSSQALANHCSKAGSD